MLLFFYAIAALSLFLYSYTQIDLNLTLSQMGFVHTIQKAFQYVGYFNRPLSTMLYAAILAVWFVLYGVVLRLGYQKKLTAKQVWTMVVGITVLLVFSYPAFSYDIFNYVFTAKTVLVYHKSPYAVIPLQFAGIDPLLSFMRWTHLPSAYTPLWIGLTLPFYMLGLGYFLPVLFSMKILVASLYLAACWFLYQSLKKLEPKFAAVGLAIFALNPLVVIESLVSAHNDIAMMAFAMASLWFFLQQKRAASFVAFALSVALKLVTAALLPVFLVGWNRMAALILMLIGFALVVMRREVLPWYWVWVMPFVALMPRAKWVTILAAGVSLGLLLRYAPYLYLGNWDPPAADWKWWGTAVPIIATVLFLIFNRVFRKK